MRSVKFISTFHVIVRARSNRKFHLNRLVKHVRTFAIMMTGRHGDRLEQWITTVEHDDTPAPLAGFARNLRRDLAPSATA